MARLKYWNEKTQAWEYADKPTTIAKQDLTGYAKKTDIPTKISQLTNDKGYLTEHQDISNLATKEELQTKQNTLISGTNIKTINNQSLLGNGNITIEGGSGGSSNGEANFDSILTNCITKAPKPIKYTLTNGVFTLHAGSIVIVPYGNKDLTAEFPIGSRFLNDNYKVAHTQFIDNKFIVRAELVNDLVQEKSTSNSKQRILWLDVLNNELDGAVNFGSGISVTDSRLFYNTDKNTIDYYENGTPWGRVSTLPLGFATSDGVSKFGTIDQLFNGMGYMGCVLWVDKGFEGLLSDGINDDGTVKSIKGRTENVLIYVNTSRSAGQKWYCFETPENGVFTKINYISPYSLNTEYWVYEESNNVWNRKGTGEIIGMLPFAFSSNEKEEPYIITSLEAKRPFRAVDYDEVSRLSMPSIKYDDLILGASGTEYDAPADGWFVLQKQASASGQYISINNAHNELGFQIFATSSSQKLKGHIPVRRGGQVTVTYTASATADVFRFIYAEGEV